MSTYQLSFDDLPSMEPRRRIVIPMVWINEMLLGHPIPANNSDSANEGR